MFELYECNRWFNDILPYIMFNNNRRCDGRRGEPGNRMSRKNGKYTKKYADGRQKRGNKIRRQKVRR